MTRATGTASNLARPVVTLFPEFSGAVFSPCGLYRYRLWRTWDATNPPLTFVMLNPSTAGAVANDPTVERCQRRAEMMGFGGVRVANIFALRSTDPGALYTMSDPIGPGNDAAILALAREGGMVICAWGTHGTLAGRGAAVMAMLCAAGIRPHHLGVNADGTPKHPLYRSYKTTPQPY